MANDIISLANEIATEKENIRQAINTAGVDCPEDTPLKEYAGKISSIQNRIDEVGTDIFYKDTDSSLTQETTSYTVASNYAVVGTSGLSGYTALQSVTLPNVTAVLDSGFTGCKALTTITAPLCKWFGANALADTGINGAFTNNEVEYFGNGCFKNNTKLTSVSLTKALYLGTSCFEGCNKVKTISIPKVRHIGTHCFKNFANNIYDDSATLQTWDLLAPDAEVVGMYCAQANTALNAIDMPKATYIGNYAFSNCSKLLSINLPSVKYIGNYAFNVSDTKIHNTDLSLPSCEEVGERAFYYRVFPKITLKDGCKVYSYAFYAPTNNTILKQVVGKIGYAGDYAFYYNTALTDVDLSACTYVGSNAFCDAKITVIDLSACEYIGSNAFTYNTSGAKVWLPSTITKVESYAFQSASNLQIYTDVADAASRPSGWNTNTNTFPGGTTWHYGATYDEFLAA